jgi:hypothetical protein
MTSLAPYNYVQDFVKFNYETTISKSAYIVFLNYITPVASCIVSQGLSTIENKDLRDFARKHKNDPSTHIRASFVEKWAEEHYLKKTNKLTFQQIASILEIIMAELFETLETKITAEVLNHKLEVMLDLKTIKRKASRKVSHKRTSAKTSPARKISSLKRSARKTSPRKSGRKSS